MSLEEMFARFDQERRDAAERLGIVLTDYDLRHHDEVLLYNNPRPQLPGDAELEIGDCGGVTITCPCHLEDDEGFSLYEPYIYLNAWETPPFVEDTCPRCGYVYFAEARGETDVRHGSLASRLVHYDGSV